MSCNWLADVLAGLTAWLVRVEVDGFANTFLVDVNSGFLMVLNQEGSLFGACWGYFGRLWLLVATFQAHLAPRSRKLMNFVKK